MAIDIEATSKRLRSILSADAKRLFEHMLAMTEQYIQEGWRVFYAREIWFKELLPPSLINELGRRYMAERLREAIWRPFGQMQGTYESALIRRLYDDPAARAGYRNFLDVGTLQVEEIIGPSVALDAVADALAGA